MEVAGAETAVRLRPRRRTWDRNRELHEEVELTAEALTGLFGMRMEDAARSLGVSATTLKIACRRLGIERWPYSRTGRVRVRTGIVTWEPSGEVQEEFEMTAEALTPFFGMRMVDAARSLGVSVTTLKTVCRKLGLERWPYSRTGPVRVLAGVSGAGSFEAGSVGGAGSFEAGSFWGVGSVGGGGSFGGVGSFGGAGSVGGAGSAVSPSALWGSTESGEEGDELCFLACG